MLPWSWHFVKKFLFEAKCWCLNICGSLKDEVTILVENRLHSLTRPEAAMTDDLSQGKVSSKGSITSSV